MPVILVDANIEGQCKRIWMRMNSPDWRELTTALDVTIRTFREIGLNPASRDDAVWRFCQTNGYYLLTSNRNEDSEDSLGVTIRAEGSSSTLPVFTLPMPDRVYHSPEFLERVIERLLDYILFAENVRGTGRLYLP